jgi:hypothetical protein
MQTVKKLSKLSGSCRVNAYYTLVIKAHIILKQNTSLNTVGQKFKSFGKLFAARAIGLYIHHSEKLAQSERRAHGIGIGAQVKDYKRFLIFTK